MRTLIANGTIVTLHHNLAPAPSSDPPEPSEVELPPSDPPTRWWRGRP